MARRFLSKLGRGFSKAASFIADAGATPLGSVVPGLSQASVAIRGGRQVKNLIVPDTNPVLANRGIVGRGSSVFSRLQSRAIKQAEDEGLIGLPSLKRTPGIVSGGGFGTGRFGGVDARADGPLVGDPMFPVTLPDSAMKTYFRAPKGYVIVRDAVTGLPHAVLKSAARSAGLWKPAKKPPISVGDWQCLLKANRTVKKLKQVVKKGEQISSLKPRPRPRAPVNLPHHHHSKATID